jgi:hypothetical protein
MPDVTVRVNTRLSNEALRVRLAARTLVEWNAPTDSPDYRMVLLEMLSLCSFCKFTDIARLLEYDRRGSVLWFLSDSLEHVDDEITGGQAGGDGEAVARAAVRQLSIMASSGGVASVVAETIFQGLQSHSEELEGAAYEAILSMENVEELRISEVSRRLLDDLGGAFRPGARLRRLIRQRHNVARWIAVAVKCIVLGAMSLVGYLGFLGAQKLSPGGARIVVGIGVPLFLAGALTTYRRSVVPTLLHWSQRFMENSSEIRNLHTNIARVICTRSDGVFGKRPELWVGVLRHQRADWLHVALANTRLVSVEVIRQCIDLLRAGDVPFAHRNAVLRWLCGVSVQR